MIENTEEEFNFLEGEILKVVSVIKSNNFVSGLGVIVLNELDDSVMTVDSTLVNLFGEWEDLL